MPSMGQIISQNKTGTQFEQHVLGNAVARNGVAPGHTNHASGLTARARAQRAMTYDTAMAMQAAKQGDDSELLPYQPTPSINPPRPRTLAAGYDKDSKVMRVRFRDGTVYGYADVTPTEWRNFKRVKSPGRAINRTFDYKDYWREDGL